LKKRIKKIAIVGGGSAGWMTAALLCRQFPQIDITLIESPNVPIIGVGESTLGSINYYLGLLGLKDEDWMPYCNATYKLAIKFTDFYQKGEEFYYPFGVKDTTNTTAGINDWFVKKTQHPETHHNDFYDSFYSCMPFVYEGRIPEEPVPGFSWKNDSAYQVDATLFGQFLKDQYCLPRGVKYLERHVDGVNLDESGYIDSLSLRDDDNFEADLFVDCSGFQSLLLEKTLGVNFTSFSDILPNNWAWAGPIPFQDQERETTVVTNCTALDNGWVWNIPLINRTGNGYVFSDKFTTKEAALEEFKAHLGPRSEGVDFRLVEIRNGVHDRCWYKNCVAVGLSYGFLEPLESTGLLLIQEAIVKLCETLHNDMISKIHVDNFNYYMKNTVEHFKIFIAYHFTMSARRDTPYWRYMTEEVDMGIDTVKIVGDYAYKFLQSHELSGSIAEGGMPDIFVGMHQSPINSTQLAITNEIMSGHGKGKTGDLLDPLTQMYWDQKKRRVTNIMNRSPSHYQYLKKHIYKN